MIIGQSRLICGPSAGSARLPLSPALVAQLRAADPEYVAAAQGEHGKSAGLSNHALQQEDPCPPCAEFLAELVRCGVVREVAA